MSADCLILRDREAGFKLHDRLNTTRPVFVPAAPLPSVLLWSQPNPSDPRACPQRRSDSLANRALPGGIRRCRSAFQLRVDPDDITITLVSASPP